MEEIHRERSGGNFRAVLRHTTFSAPPCAHQYGCSLTLALLDVQGALCNPGMGIKSSHWGLGQPLAPSCLLTLGVTGKSFNPVITWFVPLQLVSMLRISRNSDSSHIISIQKLTSPEIPQVWEAVCQETEAETRYLFLIMSQGQLPFFLSWTGNKCAQAASWLAVSLCSKS